MNLVLVPEIKGLIRGGVEQAYARTREAMKRDLPDSSAFYGLWSGHTAIVVGGGPSLASTVGQIRARKKLSKKTIVVAPNKSHDWLVARGIIPDIAVMMDPAPWLIDCFTPRKDVLYFLGASIDPKVLDKFRDAGAAVVLTHYGFDPHQCEKDVLEREFPGRPAAIVYGGSTSGMRSVILLAMLGVDNFILHGMDSCRSPGSSSLYIYDKPVVSAKERNIFIRNRARKVSFSAPTNEPMRVQVSDFDGMLRRFRNFKVNGTPRNIRIRAAGDGAVPWMCFQAGEEARAEGKEPQVDHVDPATMRKKYRGFPHFDYDKGLGMDMPPEPDNQDLFEPTLLDVLPSLPSQMRI